MFKKPRKAGDTLNITPDKTKSKLLQRSREKFWSNWSKFVISPVMTMRKDSSRDRFLAFHNNYM